MEEKMIVLNALQFPDEASLQNIAWGFEAGKKIEDLNAYNFF